MCRFEIRENSVGKAGGESRTWALLGFGVVALLLQPLSTTLANRETEIPDGSAAGRAPAGGGAAA